MNLTFKHHHITFVFLVSAILLATLTESKVINCRPLPQCCRRYVFSPACRGVSAKRSDYPLIKANDEILRDPRFFPADGDYVSNSGFSNHGTTLSDEDIKKLNFISKNEAEENTDYSF